VTLVNWAAGTNYPFCALIQVNAAAWFMQQTNGAKITASASGTTLTVISVNAGAVGIGQVVFNSSGGALPSNPSIVSGPTACGGNECYVLNASETLSVQTLLTGGVAAGSGGGPTVAPFGVPVTDGSGGSQLSWELVGPLGTFANGIHCVSNGANLFVARTDITAPDNYALRNESCTLVVIGDGVTTGQNLSGVFRIIGGNQFEAHHGIVADCLFLTCIGIEIDNGHGGEDDISDEQIYATNLGVSWDGVGNLLLHHNTIDGNGSPLSMLTGNFTLDSNQIGGLSGNGDNSSPGSIAASLNNFNYFGNRCHTHGITNNSPSPAVGYIAGNSGC
jgi:hypothetical protein